MSNQTSRAILLKQSLPTHGWTSDRVCISEDAFYRLIVYFLLSQKYKKNYLYKIDHPHLKHYFSTILNNFVLLETTYSKLAVNPKRSISDLTHKLKALVKFSKKIKKLKRPTYFEVCKLFKAQDLAIKNMMESGFKGFLNDQNANIKGDIYERVSQRWDHFIKFIKFKIESIKSTKIIGPDKDSIHMMCSNVHESLTTGLGIELKRNFNKLKGTLSGSGLDTGIFIGVCRFLLIECKNILILNNIKPRFSTTGNFLANTCRNILEQNK